MKTAKRIFVICFIASLCTLLFFANTMASCTSSCSYNGCNVTLTQYSNSWDLEVACSDGYTGSDSGDGQFGGTICGGWYPCQA